MTLPLVPRLAQRLADVWTLQGRDGGGAVSCPRFVPPGWVSEGNLDRGRIALLRGAGWEIREIGERRYLIPDDELARYALGQAYDDYRLVVDSDRGGEPATEAPAGEFGDLEDAILHSNSLAHNERLASGARLLYPETLLK